MGACGTQKAKGPIVVNKIPPELKQSGETPETKTGDQNIKQPVNGTQGKEIILKVYREGEGEPQPESFDANWTLMKALQKSIVRKLPRNAEFILLGPTGQDITSLKDKKLQELAATEDTYSVTLRYLGLDICKDPKKAYSLAHLIGAPKFDSDPIGIITFDKKTYSFKSIQVNKPELVKDFGYFSSFCNGRNLLFLSGGERERKTERGAEIELMSDFVSIDLTSGSTVPCKNLLKARSMHSMIYVPDKWVFVVGGTDTKSVNLLNIENGNLTEDSTLIEERSEPSLCLVRDDQYAYLYAFCGFKYKMSPNTTIERCNLQVKDRTWEVVNYKSNVPLKICFFATSYLKDDILLLGGSESSKSNTEKSFTYNWRADNVEASNIPAVSEVFNEKFFIPLGDNWSALMPMPSCDQAKVLILREGKIETMTYQEPAEDLAKSRIMA
jgi:hypothetical protein